MLWCRMSYSKSDPRNRHGAWHVVGDRGTVHFKCGGRQMPNRQYQYLNQLEQPRGTVCLRCMRTIHPAAVEFEVARRNRRG